jgi:hypothetical protein
MTDYKSDSMYPLVSEVVLHDIWQKNWFIADIAKASKMVRLLLDAKYNVLSVPPWIPTGTQMSQIPRMTSLRS